MRVGQTEQTLYNLLVQKYLRVDWLLFQKPTRNLGSLPRNRVRTCGASKIAGTTSLSDAEVRGLISLFASAIKPSINNFARLALWMARWLPLIYQRLVTVLPVTR